ncbi:hypothetical protein ACFS07_18095 [Undibacterium arcticum]
MQNEPVAASDSIYRSMQPGARDTTVSAQLSSQWNKNLAFGLPTLESTNSSSLNPYSVKTHALNVEEISDVTQEAEFWMSLNDPQRALEILEPQSDVASPDSPVPWLYLLDLYRDMGSEDKYNALRDRFQLIFNAHIPIFKEDVLTLRPRSLEDFPNLMGRICDAWNTDGIMPFLESLLIDDRDGARVGFDLPVYREILMLIAIVRELDRALAIEFPGADLAKLKAAIHRPHQKADFPLERSGRHDPGRDDRFRAGRFQNRYSTAAADRVSRGALSSGCVRTGSGPRPYQMHGRPCRSSAVGHLSGIERLLLLGVCLINGLTPKQILRKN